MGVKLRQKKIKEGVSFYLDISHNGKRWTEFLNIYIKGNRRNAENVENKRLALAAQSARDYQLKVEKNHLPNERLKQQYVYAFIEEKQKAFRSKSISQIIINKLVKFAGEKPITFEELNGEKLVSFMEFLKQTKEGERKLGDGTIYTVMSLLCSLLNRAVEDKIIRSNPYYEIPKKKRPKKKQSIPSYLSTDEIEKLMQSNFKIPEQLKLAFAFSCFTGLRWSDCSRLKWAQIRSEQFEGKAIQVLNLFQQKTQQGEFLPLSQQAYYFLQLREASAKDEPKSLYVFPALYEPNGEKNIHTWAAGLIRRWGEKSGIEKRVHFHLARHTFATLALMNGADIYMVSKLLGHYDIGNTQIYAHVVNEAKIKAVANLPELFGGKGKQKPAA